MALYSSKKTSHSVENLLIEITVCEKIAAKVIFFFDIPHSVRTFFMEDNLLFPKFRSTLV